MKTSVAVIGAGPAGLTAAYLLSKRGWDVTVLEADPAYVGGLSRTVHYNGFHFDIGGHRFFSKSKAVEDLWTELLPNDLLDRPRSSRIYYRGRFFSYPLRPAEALVNLGVWESARCMASFAAARLFPVANPRSFEDWVSNQFGKRLFRIFFKTYTEKVWGMDCKQISADWAAQRIKGLSLGTAILHGLLPRRPAGSRDAVVKTLIDSFRYPRLGPGMMWEAAADRTRAQGGRILMGHTVERLRLEPGGEGWTVEARTASGTPVRIEAEHVVSSAPLRDLVRGLEPRPGDDAVAAAEALRYRDFITVALIVRDRGRFDDNWIYIHEPSVRVGRIQNFKSWSPEMVPDPSLNCYGLEYFCFEGDGLWSASDEELLALARRELAQLGLAHPSDVQGGTVVRQRKAYPVYDDDYSRNVATLRAEVEARYPRLHVVGRNGMHKYNNQDHAMMTAMLTVENIVAGTTVYDVWAVNQDAEYHEAGQAGMGGFPGGVREVPTRVS